MYDILVIDPPWSKKKGGLRASRPNQDRNLDYSTMSTADIFNLLDKEIFTKAFETNTVFMWTIDSYLIECEQAMIERGYKRHCRFIWNKENGIAPAFTVRYSHEYLVWYYKPMMIPIDSTLRGKYMTVFSEKSREHSRKPDYAYNMIHNLYPNYNKIDVFSREKRKHFEQWGNEINHF